MFFHVHYKCCILLCGVYGIRIHTLTTLHFNYFAIRSLSQQNVTKHFAGDILVYWHKKVESSRQD